MYIIIQHTPQHEFAANDIKTALETKGFTVKLKDIALLDDKISGKKIVIALNTNTNVTTLLTAQGGSAVNGLGEQAYALRTTTTRR